ncbi:peptidoglycan endopeptidase LytE [Psychrobacillus insolitus]|uniref:Peptidoglycan endopeptidase LytE n=1 Tax=Psychrobacillus insolitus TaxID=1461 RepID=A0A2W7MGE5_9BACI|nr:SH3 domain-containing C40 family peptidase [Psychrobacillus insolitus]PZX05923.1 peptidoglycan endopeptidase LytE [Psychrobacillus insolitus]
MKKFLTTVIMAGALLIASPVGAANLEFSNAQNKEVTKSTVSYANPSVDQVASSRAYTVSGTYKTNYNTNVRADAGTNYKKVTLAKKGTIVTATHKKTIGGKVWYKVNVNGKSGWILSSLLAIVKPTKKATTAKITTKAVTKTSSNISTTNSSNMISVAKSLLGTPYRFGGTTTAGFDCSGYVQYVYKKSGKNISRNTATQFAQTDTVKNPQPGDLVFFANTYKSGISHVGIYIGNNSFIHSGGKKAEIISLNNSYWGKKFHSFKRL